MNTRLHDTEVTIASSPEHKGNANNFDRDVTVAQFAGRSYITLRVREADDGDMRSFNISRKAAKDLMMALDLVLHNAEG